jgi:hypothetical protein
MADDLAGSGGYKFASKRFDVAQAPADLRHLLDVWREHAGAGWLPHPSSATFDAFLFLIGRVHLVDAAADGTFRYRLYGTASVYPLDVHKRTTAAIKPAALRALVEADYRECVAEAVPIYREVTMAGPRRSGKLRRLLLPYASDGKTPDLLVVGIDEEPALADIFRDPLFHMSFDDLVLEDPD